MAVLATVAFPLAELAHRRQQEEDLRLALRTIRTAIDQYKQLGDEGRIARPPGGSGYPETLELLVEGVADARSPTGAKIYLLRRLPEDPFVQPQTAANVTVDGRTRLAQTAKAWGKRAYSSDAHEPRPGEDVYDVFSQSDGVGLNGIPYRDW